jgi:hypothetical protein
MKYEVGVASSDIMFILNFMETGQLVQKFQGGHTNSTVISSAKERRLKIGQVKNEGHITQIQLGFGSRYVGPTL